MGQVLTVPEVAKMLQISNSTVYKYSNKGILPSFHIGQRVRFLDNEINDYIRENIRNERNNSNSMWKY